MSSEQMIEKISWEEFRDNGFLWMINSILHMFGLSIVVDIDDGKITNVYPARCKFRGFNEDSNSKGYKNITHYMKDHIDTLMEDVKDIED